MFCPKCRCEFAGWTGKCPNCKTPLVEELPTVRETADKPISYETLVDLVRENGGQLRIDLSTTDVGMEKRRGFPYSGYGFAWAKRMQGDCNDIWVDLTTTEVGMEKKQRFPYRGYGFAWARAMRGYIGGNKVALTARKVAKEQKWSFPYSGYGSAWTQEMSGECGGQLEVDLLTTDVGRRKGWGFPYLGYRFAWANSSILTLTLTE